MVLDTSEMLRGAVCLALFPFTPGFPLEVVSRSTPDLLAQLDAYGSIDDVAATVRPGDPPLEIVTQAKLRRVLLLQDGTHARMHDVFVAAIRSVKDTQKTQRPGWYARLAAGQHPAQMLIGASERHGTGGTEAVVNLLDIRRVKKAALLRRTGWLSNDEMRAVSERIVRTLQLDISGLMPTQSPHDAADEGG